MFESLEGTIAAAVVESLNAISVADGYHTDQPLPKIEVDAALVGSSTEWVRFAVDVEIGAVGSGRADRVRRALDFVADIRRRLLDEDPTLGGRALSVEEVAVEEPAADPLTRNDGSARLSFEVRTLPAEADEKEQA